MEKGHEPEKQNTDEPYSFLEEKIKEKPVDWKRVILKMLCMAGAGFVFGICVCMGFYGLKPWASRHFGGTSHQVVIPKEKDGKKKESKDQDKADVSKSKEEHAMPPLNLVNYEELNRAIYDVAREASRCLVKVNAFDQKGIWLEAGGQKETTGILMGDNGNSVLILMRGGTISGENSVLRATFPDGKMYESQLVKQDKNLDLAVISVPKESLSDNTWTYAKYATLGNSNVASRGDTVIALGSPFGVYGGMAYGILSDVKDSVVRADGEFDILTSDIGGTTSSSGILVNLHGEIIGFICGNQEGQNAGRLIAYPTSDIAEQLEHLLNQKAIPYLGVLGADIPETMRQEKKVTEGIYVKEIQPDSPAMQAGIQSGDILVAIEGKKTGTLGAFKSTLLSLSPGAKIKIKGKRAGASGYVDISYDVVVGSKE